MTAAIALVTEPVRMLVGFDNDEDDEAYVYGPVSKGEADGFARRHEVVVPAELAAEYDSTWSAFRSVQQRIIDLADVDDEGRPPTVCAEWIGAEYPGRVWWTFEIERSDDPTQWPQIDIEAGHHDSPDEARLFLTSMADPVVILAHGRLWSIPKERITIQRQGYTGTVTECEQCGRGRDDHPKASA